MSDEKHRYHLEGNSIIFHDVPLVFHKNFWFKYRNMTLVKARKELKYWWSRKFQDEIIHFLKTQNRIK